jgi:hypothetical protein
VGSDGRGDPSAEEIAEFLSFPRRPPGVDYEGLRDPEHELDQPIERVFVEAGRAPIQVVSLDDGSSDQERCIRGHAGGVGACASRRDQKAQVLLLGQRLQRVSDSLDDGLGRIMNSLKRAASTSR